MTADIVAAYMALPPKKRYLIARRLGVIEHEDQTVPRTQAQLDKLRLERVHQRGLIDRLAAAVVANP